MNALPYPFVFHITAPADEYKTLHRNERSRLPRGAVSYRRDTEHSEVNSGLLPAFQHRKVKQSHYRPGQALKVPGGWGSRISRQSAHEGGKIVSPTHRPQKKKKKIPGTHFCYRLSRPQGHSAAEGYQWQIPMTPSGIEPATFRLVAQCLIQLRHHVPYIYIYIYIYLFRFSFKQLLRNTKKNFDISQAMKTTHFILFLIYFNILVSLKVSHIT
jgi:hypothetical protein